MLRTVLLVLCLASGTAALNANDWPHWRGPLSTGAAGITDAPVSWSAADGVVWRTEIEGYGISSPVTAANRVYLTTAVSEKRRPAARMFLDLLAACLAVLGLSAFARVGSRAWRTGEGRVVASIDLAICCALGLAVAVFAAAMALGPHAVDGLLTTVRGLGVAIARAAGREHTNLWFLDWDEAARHNIWIVSSGVSLVALALQPFSARSRRMRVTGAAILVGGTVWSIWAVPWSDAYGTRYPAGPLIVLYAPALALAAWHAFAGFLLDRTHQAPWNSSTERRVSRLIPVPLAIAVWAAPNLAPEREIVTRRLVSLDAHSGSVVWQRDVFATPPEAKFAANSHATPTPVVAGDTIVAGFGSTLAAFHVSGTHVWTKTFAEWTGTAIYGAGSSPVAENGVVFVTSDREYHSQRQSSVKAYSVAGGEAIWSATPAFAHDGYASPVIYRDAGRPLLIALTSQAIVGYDTRDGSIAWRLRIPVSTPIPTPIVDRDRLFLSGGKGDDGYTAAYRLRPGEPPELLWDVRRNPADVSSPVLYKERLFTISSGGIMVCYDAASGALLWRRRLGTGLGVFYASLAAADDKVYAVRSDGAAFVVAAEDEFRLIATSYLPEDVFASPALSRHCLLVRSAAAVYCIRARGGD